ncbi:serine/threonine-protein kinase [Leptothoe kymatousa]|uniref:Serine/threonine protein kinase n=1 Tax=Leptothoe kymatousa TAU-MAC 1615 TaxID=2364775 RepID=A0ABS5Y2D2_9CYAN|nr:serine/threonine-protein kinase [Leptothoe kymatousa]MBT9312009.1 serine/threonine protein kinase [Leptothoe kymatousa TAU-MAC 1615]
MSLCINPSCSRPDHPNNNESSSCQACGTTLILMGRYRVMRLLSDQTGFGTVYEAYERDSPKILKVLRPEHGNNTKVLAMFHHEASVLSRLRHPGVPFVEPDGYFQVLPTTATVPLHCIVMEKIDGLNLTQWMQQQGNHPIQAQQAIKWLTQLVKILDQLHQNSYFHRDIKPQNVMIRTSGQLALVDFGAAREVTQTYLAQVSRGGVATAISSAGYTPPEQEHGQAVPQSDFYALGRTLIYLLTAKAPTDTALYDALHNRFDWRPHAPQISPGLANLLDSMTAARVVDRPVNAQVILAQLEQLGPQEPSVVATVPETSLPINSFFSAQTPPGPDAMAAPDATSVQRGITTPSWQTLPKTAPKRRRPKRALLVVGLLLMVLGAIAIRRYPREPATFSPNPQVAIAQRGVQLQRTLPNHSSTINDLLLFVDGLRMVSAGADNSIRLWDLTNGKQLEAWDQQTSFVNTILLSPDETRLYSGNADGTLQGWVVANGNLLWQNSAAHQGPVNVITRTPDGQKLVSAGADGYVHVWQASTGKLMTSVKAEQGPINSLVVTSDSRYIITAGSDRTINFWNFDTGKSERTLTGHESFINALAISPDGRFLFSASADGTIRQWKVKTGKLLRTLVGHTSYVNDMIFSRDGQTLSTGSADKTVRIWNVETGTPEQVLTGFGMFIDHLLILPSQQMITASRAENAIKIWQEMQ